MGLDYLAGAGGITHSASGWSSFVFPAVFIPLFFVALYYLVRAMQGNIQTNPEKNGTPGNARVSSLKNFATSRGGYQNVWQVGLRVEIPGQQPYDVIRRQWFTQDEVGRLQPGSTVAVRVNRKKPHKVYVDLSQPSTRPVEVPFVAPEDIAGLTDQIKAALQSAGVGPVISTAASADPLDRLSKLAELRDRGVLTDAEFEAQKQKLLGEHG
ncbi:SHOCT domain-containing protein [Mycolicibacterium sp. CBMA 226]|uniref:SHOCT domain-containing protein n=1 Tax=Mycolicibacterium sp. CBMA 226 TaxID=2606611 RepID=UPI0012DD6E98|nr:SHOCT domain-containing protein [Mycolicibacterium sp. CBMA 226]MUL76469.1 SHOCT domain-containing protein [Mycolicibacterium sp. CBMA 226]